MNDGRTAAQSTLGLALASLLISSCVVVGATKRTEIDEAGRLPVRFPSVQAAHDFHEGLRQSDRAAYTDASGLAVPLLFGRATETYHETAHYNAEVRLADVDRDGAITEEEARAYLDLVLRELAGEDEAQG